MDAQARSLLWRCRRGMKELDVLLERYAAAALPQADAAERGLLARLLACADPELAGYFLGGQTPPEPEIAALVTRIAAAGKAPLRDPPARVYSGVGTPQETTRDRTPLKALDRVQFS